MFRTNKQVNKVWPSRESLAPHEIKDYAMDVALLDGVDPWEVYEIIEKFSGDGDIQADELFKIAYASQHRLFTSEPEFPAQDAIKPEINTTIDSRSPLRCVGAAAIACASAGGLYAFWKVSGQLFNEIDFRAYGKGFSNFYQRISGDN